ncbi:MAG: hypothetical protein JWM41_345 [Gemmatimonadetes bacterium]|nr:hypothetical protein [Gemmatimonadota bacterium]
MKRFAAIFGGPVAARVGAFLATVSTSAVLVAAMGYTTAPRGRGDVGPAHFLTADRCMACHNGLSTPSGRDASIGLDWRASMMANSSRDPYWQASVRREVLDHTTARAEIQDECSTCHMPMQRYAARAAGGQGLVFDRFPTKRGTDPLDSLAADGVSCTMCHQIQKDRLGDSASFNGGFVIDTTTPVARRPVFGPYVIDRGHTKVMHTSSSFVPTQGDHIRQSELCATCHTLYTPTLDATGRRVGTLPEQMPFLEWRHSAYRTERSCQSCHMPLVVAAGDSVPITVVQGQPRPDVRRHWFPGANFFVLGMLNRYRAELAVEAFPQELEAVTAQTREILAQAATVAVKPAQAAVAGHVVADVDVTNLTGHKLPTAFPSRRAWLHVVVRDRTGATVFESGALTPTGRIVGNDNDDDRMKYEPHYREITQPGQVQIYESIMHDPQGAVTTGLLSGIGYAKDNRILPRGFDKRTANSDVAVAGDAASDPAFVGGSHRIRYNIDVARAQGPFRIVAELWYQPIGFRWAQNLRLQPAPETNRFVAYFESMADASGTVLARDSVIVR